MQPSIAYVGMTHLGLCSAVGAASKGFTTLGFDRDAALVDRLEAGKLPVVEPQIDDLLRAHADRIAFSNDPARLRACDVIYVAPDVPTDDHGKSDLTGLDQLLEFVMANTRPEAVVVVLSQVPPGFTRARQRPGRLLYYQVETLVFGRAIERATQPERFIVGCPDPAEPLPAALAAYLSAFGCPILPMRFESAELAKISINFCLVASVSVANTLAEVCEQIGADWSEIAPALKLDRRIGQHSYLSPGLGISGGNLERDLQTVLTIGKQDGTDVGLIEAWQHNSQYRKDWPWRTLDAAVLAKNPKAVIAVLGLAYKENTHSTKNSPSLRLMSHLEGRTVRVHDPVVAASIVPFAQGCKSALECVQGADVAVLVTPWPEYRELKVEALARAMRGRVIIDPYRLVDGARARAAGFSYYTLGQPALVPA